jgi:hypothetical protein
MNHPPFFSGYLTWRSHSHFVKVMYMIEEPIGRSVVCSNSLLHFSSYSSSPPYLCFPFVGGWYAYSRSCIRCGSYFFMIASKKFNIKAFSATNKMCSLVSIKVGPLYITSFWFFYSQFDFSYFGHTNEI